MLSPERLFKLYLPNIFDVDLARRVNSGCDLLILDLERGLIETEHLTSTSVALNSTFRFGTYLNPFRTEYLTHYFSTYGKTWGLLGARSGVKEYVSPTFNYKFTTKV